MKTQKLPAVRYRTVWVSDIHLGTRGCQAESLLYFLRNVRCDTLYLVGDIIDVWSLRRSVYWPQSHNDVVRTLLGKAKNGTRVVYIPGNHDDLVRAHTGTRFGNLEICREAIHHTADNQRLLVLHGDEFDSVVQYSKLLAVAGSIAYEWLLSLNRLVNASRHWFGRPYWSLAGYLKHKVKNAVQFIDRYQETLAQAAKSRDVDGIICGHIHRATLEQIGQMTYANTGDWVESCTALVEHDNGQLELLEGLGTRAWHRSEASEPPRSIAA
ncbi:MAG: UDP-2,3-diacylglucosamine diphosphatase [Gammaproteobacteria bacterium]